MVGDVSPKVTEQKQQRVKRPGERATVESVLNGGTIPVYSFLGNRVAPQTIAQNIAPINFRGDNSPQIHAF